MTTSHLESEPRRTEEGWVEGPVTTTPTHSAGARSSRGFLDVQKVLTLELECKQLLFPDVPRFRKDLNAWVKRHKQILYHDFAQDRTDSRWQDTNKRRLRLVLESGPIAVGDLHSDPAKCFALFEAPLSNDLGLAVQALTHYGLFANAIINLGSEWHREHLLPLVASHIGCVAFHEVGNASSGLVETTARFDAGADRFIVDTPTPAARKWLVSNLPRSAAWAIVWANLLVEDHNYGVHPFVVRLRKDNDEPEAGVRITDCGAKGGLSGLDVGGVAFEGVQIPRAHLLDRFGTLSAEGEYSSAIRNPSVRVKVMLRHLIFARIASGLVSLTAARQGLTIALNHALKYKAGPPQHQIPLIRFPLHQRRLIPHLASTIAYTLFSQRVKGLYAARQEENEETWREIALLASAFKVGASAQARATLQACTECCGGSSLLGRNQLAHLRNDVDCMLHWEGDNLLLLKYVGKELIRNYERGLPQGLIEGVVSYAYTSLKEEVVEHVNMLKKALSFISFNFYNNLRTRSWHLRGFLLREHKLLESLSTNLRKDLERDKGRFPTLFAWQRPAAASSPDAASADDEESEEATSSKFEILNKYLNEINVLSKCHIDRVVLQHVYLVLDRETERSAKRSAAAQNCSSANGQSCGAEAAGPVLSKRALNLLEKLFNLFALEIIERDNHFFVAEEFVTPMQLKMIKFEIDALCQEISSEDEKAMSELVNALSIDPIFWRHTFTD